MNPSNIEIEYELTFLARELPSETHNVDPIVMEDVYFPESSPHAQLRARRKNDSYEITKKKPLVSDPSVQTEQTIPLSAQEYESLVSASNKRVSKLRYKVLIDGHEAEVDVFQGSLTGLVIIDFEFSSEAEKNKFSPPSVCLVDITKAEFIAGGYISGKSYEDIADELNKYHYTKITS